jgi:hypothetical protein
MITIGNHTIFSANSKKECGIIFSKNYKFVYSLNKFEKKAKMNYKGIDLISGFCRFRNFAFKEYELNDNLDLLEKVKRIVVAWGILSITDEMEYQNHVEEFSGNEVTPAMKKFLMGDNTNKNFFRDAIATYIVLSKVRYSLKNPRKNCLNIHDIHWDFIEEDMKEYLINNWENHNITKINGIKSCEEFIQLLKNGIIDVNWSENALR